MRRLLAGCLGVALGWTATGRAEDVQWHKVEGAPPAPVAAPISEPPPAPVILPDLDPKPPEKITLDLRPAWPRRVVTQTAEPLKAPRHYENPIPGIADWSPDGSTTAELHPATAGDTGRRSDQSYVRGELLLWWIRGMNAPPLISTGMLPAPPVFTGLINPQVLSGGGVVGGQFMPGLRISAGTWLDCDRHCGIDASFFILPRRTDVFSATSNGPGGIPALFRPIFIPNTFNGVTIGEAAETVAFPPGFVNPPTNPFFPNAPVGSQTGTITVTTTSVLLGADLNARTTLNNCGNCNDGRRVELFGGFRFLSLSESLRVNENNVVGVNDILGRAPGTSLFLEDLFGTGNQFYGAQIGVNAEWWSGRWFADFRTSLAIGGTAQQLTINGFLVETPPNSAPTTFAGGLLALPGANIGNYSTGRFSFVSETTLNVGYQFRPRLRGFVGYNFLWWNNVMRPGDQIDRVIDVTRVPRFLPPAILAQIAPVVPPRPAVPFKQTDFWAQGLNLGLEIRY